MREGTVMATSRNEHLARIHADDNVKMAEYRRRIEEEMARTRSESFSVPLPDGPVGDPLLEQVLDEYRAVNWTVEYGNQWNDRYISFQ